MDCNERWEGDIEMVVVSIFITNAGTTIVCLKYAKIKKEGYVFFANFSLLDLN
jgi:ABC-type nitrate/sulfonate/bicarbonate transport system substrate-binding protein